MNIKVKSAMHTQHQALAYPLITMKLANPVSFSKQKAFQLTIETNILVYMLTMPVGFYILSIYII